MRKRGWAAIALGPLVLLVAACGSSSTTPGSAYGNSSATPMASGSASSSGSTTGMGTSSTSGGMGSTVTLTIKDSKIGNVLANAKGQTIYWYAKDMKGGPSTCTGSCLSAWPLVTGTPVASMGVKFAGKLGSVQDANGVVQATYNGYPLYTYTGDMAPGDTSGNGAGGVWHVISGQYLTASMSSGSGSMSGSSGSGSSGSGYGSGYSYEATQNAGPSSMSATSGTSGGRGSSSGGTGTSGGSGSSSGGSGRSFGGTGSSVNNAPKNGPAPAPTPTSSVNGGGCGEGSCW